MTAETFMISRLGAHGDGVADHEREQLFIPHTLPGETVVAVRDGKRAHLEQIVSASPDRVPPACRHFGECGGCSLQHMAARPYHDWKVAKVADALAQQGIEIALQPMMSCEPESRRRAIFSARKTEAGMLLGFNRAGSNQITPITECPILLPQIVEALPKLRQLAATAAVDNKPFRLTVTDTASGLDIDLDGPAIPGDKRRRQLADFAISSRLARLSIKGEIIIELKRPVIMVGKVELGPSPGAFLQACEAAEVAMAEIVGNHLAKARRVADLFAGSGAFSLRLATKSVVHAVESEAAALASLDRAFRFGSGLKTITHERRDLFRRPLKARELKAYDGLVFDPPRAGAEAQAVEIAKSDIPLVAAVSCNPVTLARDLAILQDGGYRLESVTPIDQFLWSAHVEAVALLKKRKKRR